MEVVNVHGAGGDVGGHGFEGLEVKVLGLEDLGELFRQWHYNFVVVLTHVSLAKERRSKKKTKAREKDVSFGSH